MQIDINGKQIKIIKNSSIVECWYPHVLFKEIGEDKWKIHNVVFTTAEKETIQDVVDKHFDWKGNVLKTYTVKANNQLDELCIDKDYQVEKLGEEMAEFLQEINSPEFDKARAIDEGWDVWTVVTNLLRLKGISMDEVFAGFEKNMDKKIKRGYKYGG